MFGFFKRRGEGVEPVLFMGSHCRARTACEPVSRVRAGEKAMRPFARLVEALKGAAYASMA